MNNKTIVLVLIQLLLLNKMCLATELTFKLVSEPTKLTGNNVDFYIDEVIDSRIEKNNIGIVFVDIFGTKTPVQIEGKFEEQLLKYFDGIFIKTPNKKAVILNIKELRIDEEIDFLTKRFRVTVQIDFYCKRGNQLGKLYEVNNSTFLINTNSLQQFYLQTTKAVLIESIRSFIQFGWDESKIRFKDFSIVQKEIHQDYLNRLPTGEENYTIFDSILIYEDGRKFSVLPFVIAGWGQKKTNKIGKTTAGDDITICGGGGNGIGLVCSYEINEYDFSFGANYQFTTLTPKVENAEGKFEWDSFLLTFKYNCFMDDKKNKLKLGVGMGYYIPGKLILKYPNISKTENVDIIQYQNTTGIHLTADVEIRTKYNFFWFIGIRYNIVAYQATNFIHNNYSLSTSYLDMDFQKLDGNSLDVHLGLKF